MKLVVFLFDSLSIILFCECPLNTDNTNNTKRDFSTIFTSYYVYLLVNFSSTHSISTFYYVTMETQHIFLVLLSLETNVNFPRNMVTNLKKIEISIMIMMIGPFKISADNYYAVVYSAFCVCARSQYWATKVGHEGQKLKH